MPTSSKIFLKHVVMVFLVTLVLFVSVSFANAQSTIKITVNGNSLNASGTTVNGRILVPLRAMFEAVGAQVNWNAATKTIIAVRGNTIVTMTVGSKTATVTDKVSKSSKKIALEVPPKIISGRTMVPVRFVGETFGYWVKWNGAAQTVELTEKQTSTIKITVNGKVIEASGTTVSGKIVVPLQVLEALGAQTDWNETTQTITASSGVTVVTMTVGSKTATVTDNVSKSSKDIVLDIPASIVNNKAMVSVSFIGQAFGYWVKWNEAVQTIELLEKQTSTIKITIDGKTLDTTGTTVKGKIVVPLQVLEALGAQVDWNETTQTVTANRSNTVATMVIGNNTATVTDNISKSSEEVALDVPVLVINGKVMVPVSFAGTTFGYWIKWNGSTQTVELLKKQ